ncbi:glycoside hydrolase family 13 protein [Planosporangium thailandense]|uniref:Glycoside hydrolase family 13 protein n=1 Tax=Planosporangium thailandense TaxID=765197 RepID=A0ABX0Y419_9ACTN|nr:glycoside hydrolase family 13 protein [Planosporangium thailandense]NJC72310.1 glycoside hydrolase family 13 protein [Planosporangium thailandense]
MIPSPTATTAPLGAPTGAPAAATSDWWRSAVVYQVYVRSFADGNGDGQGDIAGIRSRLPYLASLGVDALWINPWYPSPMADAGYDISDHRAIAPEFGTLAEAEAFIAEAHEFGLRILLDLVPNHTSDQHPWFQRALAAGPGSPERARYIFRPGCGTDGEEPPNDWRSVFGGSAWTRVTEPDGTPGEWYLHLFAPEQPDLNWEHPEVRADVERTLRFWFDLGVDGFRIDVAHGMVKAPGLPALGPDADGPAGPATANHPHWDRDELHDIFRHWRAVADSYPEPRVFVAEAWVGDPDRLARYVRGDELHTAFNFDFLRAPWRADHLRTVIDQSCATLGAVGAPTTWVLSNHDVVRHVSRYGRPQPDRPVHMLAELTATAPDLELGTRRAKAAALLMLALPGGAYVYQGDELGLWEVEDLPEECLQDPTWRRSGFSDRGRDGCRVPLPWDGDEPPFEFGPADAATPWLPQPAAWRELTAAAQATRPDSMLALYRSALRIRRHHPALGDGTLRWFDSPDDVLIFSRDPGFICAVNLGTAPVPLPAHAGVLLASGPLDAGLLPPDTAVWLAA